MQALETAQLHLRPLNTPDETFYCDLYTNESIMRHIGPPLSREDARVAFFKVCKLNLEEEFNYRLWVIARKKNGADIGLLGLIRSGDQAEIGAILIEKAQGQGFAAESIARLVDYAFSRHALDLVYTSHYPDHSLAAALMRKLAFVCSSTRGEALKYRWELSRRQWETRNLSVSLREQDAST